MPVLRRQLERAVQAWVVETRQTYGNPVIRHIMSLPGAAEVPVDVWQHGPLAGRGSRGRVG